MRRIKLGAALAAITAWPRSRRRESPRLSQTSTPIKTHGPIMTTVCGTLGGAINGLAVSGGGAATSAIGETLVAIADGIGC